MLGWCRWCGGIHEHPSVFICLDCSDVLMTPEDYSWEMAMDIVVFQAY